MADIDQIIKETAKEVGVTYGKTVAQTGPLVPEAIDDPGTKPLTPPATEGPDKIAESVPNPKPQGT